MVFGKVDRSRRIRRRLLEGCAAAVLMAGTAPAVALDNAVPASAVQEEKRFFAVEPQSLQSALNEWAIATGKDWGHIGGIGFGDIRTQGVNGEYSDHDALGRILTGTGFSFNVVATGDVSIVQIQAEEPARPSELIDTAVNNDEVIDRIIVRSVTAQRRQEDIQDVPVAVSAFDASMLSRRQITTTADLGRNVLNLIGSNNVGLGTSVTYFMRGVGSTESIATFDLPVGTYVDEVYISRQNGNQFRLSGVERVEVLRGPQGTLFGRNTTGGAVSIISQKPHDELDLGLEAGYGSFDRLTVSGFANVPLAEGLYARASGFVVNEDGFVENALNDETFNGEKSWGVRGALRWKPGDVATWDVAVQYVETDYLQIGTPEILAPTGAGTRVPVTGDLRKVRLTDRECTPTGAVATWAGQGCHFNSADAFLLISNLAFDFDAGTLNLITGWYDLEQGFNIDFIGNTNQPVFGGAVGPNFYISNMGQHTQVSQEVKWTGSLLDGRVNYVSGFFFMQEENETFFADTIFPAIPFVLANRTPLANETRSIAFYTQGDFHLTDALKLQAGVRWTEEDKDVSIEGTIDNDDLEAAGIPRHLNTSLWTPRVALSYDITEDIMAYASFTQGFKSGGWNARSTSAANFQPFGPETVDSYEVGFRTEWFDGRLLANLTLFRAVYEDFQLPTSFGSAFITLNSGTVEVDGVELEMAAQVTDTLEVFANLGLMDAKYRELAPGAIAIILGPMPEPTRTPAVMAQIGFVQDFNLPGGHLLQLASDIKYTDEYEHLAANLPEGTIEETLLLNAQLSWTEPDKHWTFIVECRNCTDDEYFTQNFFHLLYPADPRRWGVRVQYKY